MLFKLLPINSICQAHNVQRNDPLDRIPVEFRHSTLRLVFVWNNGR